jgi:hypothetical protein
MESPQPAQSAKDPKTNIDLALKLVASATVVSQAALVVYGYSHLVGYYEQFGIDTNELALGTPTLLLNGYINILTQALSIATTLPLIGPGLVAMAFVIAAAIFVWLVTKGIKLQVIIGLSAWIGILLFAGFFAPAAGVARGVKSGQSDFTKFTHQATPHGLDSIQTIITDKDVNLTGHLILADSKSTFLLVDKTVFKIDSDSGRVIRKADLKVASAEDSSNLDGKTP